MRGKVSSFKIIGRKAGLVQRRESTLNANEEGIDEKAIL